MKMETDDLRAVFARADEIQNNAPPARADIEAVIQAAAEVGIARSAVERALRERLNLPMRPLAVGDLTFAKSADEKFYVAEVVSLSGDNVRVRFLRGSEHTVSHDELRPCSFLPGERVICPWPQWGPWTCTVLSYDEAERRIEATDGWGEKRSFAIRDVWITPLKNNTKSKARVYGALLAVGATVGAAIGSLLTLLILR